MSHTLDQVQRSRVLLVAYFLSGGVALGYEVLWARMFALVLGVSIFGVVVSVAALLAGLGLGALWGARRADRIRSPLRVFAVLEALVAVYALALPLILPIVTGWISAALSGAEITTWYVAETLCALALLLIPATALGFGFPMVLTAGKDWALSLRRIYGWNTCGGALGALLPVWLLPALGWSTSLRVFAGVGFLAAMLAWVVGLRPASGQKTSAAGEPSAPVGALLAYAGVGAAALMLQIGWTRMFGLFLLRTEYVLAIILMVFLGGLGLGSLLADRLKALQIFPALPVLATLGVIAGLWAVPLLSAWAEAAVFSSLGQALVYQGAAIALFTLPVTVLLGAWLPLLHARFGGGSRGGALLYAANALGSAAGALLAGFVLIPALGTVQTVVLAALALTAVSSAWGAWRTTVAATVLAALLAWPVHSLPPVADLLPVTQAGVKELYRYEDAMSFTNVVQDAKGQRVLLTDLQRLDASTEPTAVELQKNQARLALLLHPDARSALFLGLGTGISAAGSLDFPLASRTAIELSAGAINAAAAYFTAVNGEVVDRINVVRDDVRRFLRSDLRLYDVVIGDVFHPDLAGRSALMSLEQFQRVRQRLAPGGLYVQWLALNQFDVDALDVVLRSFAQVFPAGVMYVDGFRLAMVGPRDQLLDGSSLAAALEHRSPVERERATGGEGLRTWLGRYWGPIAVGHGPIQSEWAPSIEFQLPQARYRGALDLAGTLTHLLTLRPAVETAAGQLTVDGPLREHFERGYIATELAYLGWIAELQGRAREAQRLRLLALNANPQDRWVSFAVADELWSEVLHQRPSREEEREAIAAILRLRPDHSGALQRMSALELEAGNTAGAALYRDRLRALSPYAD